MKRKRHAALPANVAKLARRIEHWRTTRARRGRMPEDLWAAAASLARAHGVYGVSRALGLSYETLKTRADASEGCSKGQEAILGGFVRVQGAEMAVGSSGCGPTVEVHHPGGVKVVVRLPAGTDLDVGDLAAAVCGGCG